MISHEVINVSRRSYLQLKRFEPTRVLNEEVSEIKSFFDLNIIFGWCIIILLPSGCFHVFVSKRSRWSCEMCFQCLLPYRTSFLTSTIAPQLVYVIVVSSGTPGLRFVLSCTSRVHFTAISEWKMAAVTIWIATVAQKATCTVSPLLIGVIISSCCAPAKASLSSCTAVLRISSVDEWEHTTSAFWGTIMCGHAAFMLKTQQGLF